MRQIIWTAFAVGALAVAYDASAGPQLASAAQAHQQAPSAERYGSPATYSAPSVGKGYSAADRHRADCLASFPGYDWRTDQIHVGHQAPRPCPL